MDIHMMINFALHKTEVGMMRRGGVRRERERERDRERGESEKIDRGEKR